MITVYVPKKPATTFTNTGVSVSYNALLDAYMKRDGSSVPLADFNWSSKKHLNVAESTESNSVSTRGFVDCKMTKLASDINTMSVNYMGISIMSWSSLMVYTSANLTAIKDVNKKYEFKNNGIVIRLLNDASSLNRLCYSIDDLRRISSVVNTADIITNNCTSIIMVIKLDNFSAQSTAQEFFWWGHSETALSFEIINTGGTTNFAIMYGTDFLAYTVPTPANYNVKLVCLGFKKNGAEGKLYFKGTPLVLTTRMMSSIADTVAGYISLGVCVNTEIYELHIFNTAINNNDMNMYLQMLIWKYEIQYKPLKAYLPALANDVATKYYVDSLSIYFKIPVVSKLSMATYRIINFGTPVNPADAATKGYCDNNFMRLQVAQALDMNNIRIINLLFPQNAEDTVNKAYVDNNFVNTTIGATLNMNNFGITNLMVPVVGSDATTKTYVDNKIKNYQILSGITVISTDLFVSNTVIFSMTQSHPGLGGYYWPVAGRALTICYNIATTVGGYTTMGIIGITKNGATITESENATAQLAQKGMKTYTTSITFAAGDTLAFFIRNVPSQPPNGVPTPANFNYFVHALVDFDL